MTTEGRLLAHVRAHVNGVSPQSLTDAGYSTELVVELIEVGRLAETPSGRIRYVHTDPLDELETR
ncbi:hypothetical protein [Rhodococcus sp. P1Y]|uniref:hypothetical protein n=1 Tax=Rhodococcus sp. P1Y TaxID=1302308 RepID=UPI000EAB8E1A|nr:hypothetical protein [Rhodococcus sp. P1Y]AYJ47507.1 hypothetical protein D8W71_03165 [Rhodococcus sp. P1Y]